MKKIIVLVLTLALCLTAFTSCFLMKGRKTLKEIAEMYSNSAPTMIVATTTQTFSAYELNCTYEVKNGLVDGKNASVYTVTKQELESIENAGGSDIIRPMIKTTKKTTQAIEGIGTRTDGGDWNASGTVTVIGRGAMALNLDSKSIAEMVYADNVLTFVIPNANIETVLGEGFSKGIEGDVQVTIVNDGAVITSIELRYTIAGDSKANLESSKMVIFVEYHYDIQQITIS